MICDDDGIVSVICSDVCDDTFNSFVNIVLVAEPLDSDIRTPYEHTDKATLLLSIFSSSFSLDNERECDSETV